MLKLPNKVNAYQLTERSRILLWRIVRVILVGFYRVYERKAVFSYVLCFTAVGVVVEENAPFLDTFLP